MAASSLRSMARLTPATCAQAVRLGRSPSILLRQGSEHPMDEFGTTAGASGGPVPGQLRSLFNHPDDVRVQELPCALLGFGSLAVHFGAGARTVPHQHHN